MAPVKSGTLSANLSSDPGDQGFDGRRPRQTGVVGQYRLFISPTTAAVKRGQRDTQSRHGMGRKKHPPNQIQPQTFFPTRFNPGNPTGDFWPARNAMQPQEPPGRGVARKTAVEFVSGCQSSDPTSCRGSLDQPQKKPD